MAERSPCPKRQDYEREWWRAKYGGAPGFSFGTSHRTTFAWQSAKRSPAHGGLTGTCFYCGATIHRLDTRSGVWFETTPQLGEQRLPDGGETR